MIVTVSTQTVLDHIVLSGTLMGAKRALEQRFPLQIVLINFMVPHVCNGVKSLRADPAIVVHHVVENQ